MTMNVPDMTQTPTIKPELEDYEKIDILVEAAACSYAVLRAIASEGLLDALPEDPKDREKHMRSTWLLMMAEEKLEQAREKVGPFY